jgi:preprotein translocase subunit SecB
MTGEVVEGAVGLGVGVQIGPPRLHRLHFEYEPGIEIPAPVPVTFEMELTRFGPLLLGVELTASIQDQPGLTARASFRVVFAIDENGPQAEDPDHAFKSIAAQMGPTTLFPFCREVLTSAAQRAGVNDFTLPVLWVGRLWSPDELDVPPPPSDEPED